MFGEFAHARNPPHLFVVGIGECYRAGDMKTVLINVFDTAVAKNIFMPQFLDVLTEHKDDIRVIVLVSHAKLEEFTRDYAHPMLEFVPRPQKFASRIESVALFLARNTIPAQSVRQIQEKGLDGSGRLPLPRYIFARIFWVFGHFKIFRLLIKRILAVFFDARLFDDLLTRYQPDLVFATTIYAIDDVRLLRSARLRGITTLGMIKSWDSLTSKDAVVVPPDRLIVHNDVVKEEAIRLQGYPAEAISVVGIPQFDGYAAPQFLFSREEFFEMLGLDKKKKLITYTSIGLWLAPHERDVIALLDRVIREGKIAVPVQLLVRMHPAYPDEKEHLKKQFPNVIIDEPGSPVRDPQNTWKADWRFTTDDVRHLASTLKYSDVTLNCGSTMIVDAACFDTPIIGIAFDGDAVEPNYWRSARIFFKREHLAKVVETGGVRLVKNEQELVEAVNEYLGNRSKDREGRKRIVKQQAGELGAAGAALARAMIATLGQNVV